MSVSVAYCIGPYEVLTKIGVGGMGEVYKAQDTRLNRTVAIKILTESFARDPTRLQRFEQEARILAALNHPNIIAVFDYGIHDGKPYLVTEFLSGETLRERLSEGALPVRKAIAYAFEIAEALSVAHDNGIVHRDLKPENIFLTTEGHVKVLDFGLARSSPPSERSDDSPTISGVVDTAPGTVMGTVGYMSPEQVRGQAVDYRSDIFSLGTVLYEMISGRRAFHGASSVETMNAILKDDPPELLGDHPEIPSAVDRILRHCLEKEPQHRFESARDLAFDLASLSTASDSSGRQPLLSKQRSLRKAVLVSLAVATVVAAAFWLGAHLLPPASPQFRKLTFQRGHVYLARFAPDPRTVLYSASWSGNPSEVFSTVAGSQDSRPLGISNADLLAVSSKGELAVLLKPRLDMAGFLHVGTLARVSMSGGTAPREIAEDISGADWSPDGSNLAVLRLECCRYADVLEYPPGKAIYHSTRPDWLSHVRISPDGRLIAVLQHSGLGDDRGRMLVFDTDGNLKFRSEMWDGVYGLAWIANRKLWVTATTPQNIARQLFELDLRGNKRAVIDLPGELTVEDVAANGAALLTLNDRRILIHAFRDGTWRDLSWLDRSILDTISADGSTILFHEGGQGGGHLGATYIRSLEGSPPVRLSDGYGVDLSPDKKWVFVTVPLLPTQYRLVPTGAGEPRIVITPDIRQPRPIGFSRPLGRALIWMGASDQNQDQMFATELDGSHPRPISPPGTFRGASHNGRFDIHATADGFQLWDYQDQAAQSVKGIERNDLIASVGDDGQWAYVGRVTAAPALRILRVNLHTGEAEAITEITLNDLAGITSLRRLIIAPDGKTLVLCYVRHLSELYVMHGQ